MKKELKRLLQAVSAAALGISLGACADSSPAVPEETPEPAETAAPEDTRHPAEISEAAMDNFRMKLDAGNYVIDTEDYMKVSVVSPHLVIFDFADEGTDDFALATMGNETFYITLNEDGYTDVQFMSPDSAVEMAGSRLPNYWFEATGGNIFEMFYNNIEKPLEFESNEDLVKTTLMSLVGYGYTALNLMHEVHMTFDAEDPSSVHFDAVVDDNPVARMFFDDIDLTLNFGNASSDPRIDQWIAAPVYPETKTGWEEGDLFYLNSVFLPGYGENALPFPDFASYAMNIDEGYFSDYERILLSDPHGTEKDLDHYIELLKADGFTEAEETGDDGTVTVYRKPLREEYKCFVEARPYYDNGFVLEAGPYYDNPAYDSLEDINAAISKFGFPELSENEHLTGWNATDTAAERSESWLYFFDYDLSLYANIHYDDPAEMKAYLDDYSKKLEAAGFRASYYGDDEAEEPELEKYASADDQTTFRYDYYGDDENIRLQFRHEKGKTPEETEAVIAGAGFPEIDLSGYITVRDITRYYRMVRAFEGPLYLNVSQPFDSTDDANAFLDDYVARLDEAGYLRTDPMMVGSLKENAYYNEEEDRYVAFDYFPAEDGTASVFMDFVANR